MFAPRFADKAGFCGTLLCRFRIFDAELRGAAAENFMKRLAELRRGREADHFRHLVNVQIFVAQQKLARALDSQILQVLIGRLLQGGFEQRGEIGAGDAKLPTELGNVHGFVQIRLHIRHGGVAVSYTHLTLPTT